MEKEIKSKYQNEIETKPLPKTPSIGEKE